MSTTDAIAPSTDRRPRSAESKAQPQQALQVTYEGYRPDIQGLRAIAVGLVVLFHLWPLRLSGGYVGVDVFFVISGYLITSHIFREVAQTGSLKVIRFWARRVRRLLPASLLVLALSAAAVVVWVPATMWQQTARQVMASALYVQNWALALDAVDYMARDNVPTVAQHYWSLSVEEQFYAVWPLLIVGLLVLQRRVSRRAIITPDQKRLLILTGLSVLAVASLVWSGTSTASDQPFAYMSTFTRTWEFAAGAIAALVTGTLPRPIRRVVAWAGILAIVGSGYVYTERSAFPGWIALLPVLGTVAVLLAGRSAPVTAGAGPDAAGPRSAAWWLALPPARFIGDISYSIYLIHWPLIVLTPFVTGHKLVWTEKLAVLAATVALAWLSKTFVEDPMRVRPLLAAAPWRAFAFAVLGMSVVLGAGVGLHAELDHRETTATKSAAAALSSTDPCLGPGALASPGRCGPVAGTGQLLSPLEVVANEQSLDIFKSCQQTLASPALLSCHLGDQSAPKRTVALVGDSHAGALLPLMDELGKQLHWDVVAATKGSCPMTAARRVLESETTPERQESCEAFNAAVNAKVLADPKITDVFVTAYSSAYRWDSVPGVPLADPGRDGYVRQWSAWVKAGKRVHVIRDVPATSGTSVPNCLAAHQGSPEQCSVERGKALPPDPAVDAAKGMRSPAVSVIDLTNGFCDDSRCYAQVGDVVVYHDRSHLSVEYATLLEPYLRRQLPAALTR